jgi:hypothetical protein
MVGEVAPFHPDSADRIVASAVTGNVPRGASTT